MQLVGKDSLSEDQKLTLDIAKVIKEEFLQQNAFSKYDFTCPLEKVLFKLFIDNRHDEMYRTLL